MTRASFDNNFAFDNPQTHSLVDHHGGVNFENEDANHDLDKKAQSFIALFPSLLLLVSHQNPLLGLFFAVRGTMETSVPHDISLLN